MEIDQLNMNIGVFRVKKYQTGRKLGDTGQFQEMQIRESSDLMVLKYLLVFPGHCQKIQVSAFDEMHLVNMLLDEYQDGQFRYYEDTLQQPKPNNKNRNQPYFLTYYT